MSDEFGTVNARKGDRAREIARLREHYRNHRETLSGLMGDAPSDHLANEYGRLVAEIDDAVRKLAEVEVGHAPSSAAVPPAPSADTNPMIRPKTRPGATAPGSRPLVRPQEPEGIPSGRNQGMAVTMMVIAGLIVLAAIAYLVWRPRTAPKPATVVEQPISSTEGTATAPPAITPVASTLKITPALADYGVIRKGTRAVRQFELVNGSAAPIEIQIARSACRCLFYDYKSKVGANEKETITVTIDGARAKAGALSEQVAVTAKKDPAMNATFTVQATVR